MDIAIIGAGMAGMSCGQQLQRAGHCVTLFDKGRGAGGRMSSRRVPTDKGEVRFDHGAPAFEVYHPDFLAQCKRWQEAGVAGPWATGGKDIWLGTPAMNAPLKHMAADLDVRWQRRIEEIDRTDGERGPHWTLPEIDDAEYGAVIIALPAEQAASLISSWAPAMADAARHISSEPCWTLMLSFAEKLPVSADVIHDAGPIKQAIRQSAKPGRPAIESWTVQASADWSRDNLEVEPDEIAGRLTRAFAEACGFKMPAALTMQAHRWRYARPAADMELAAEYIWDERLGLGLCGDWTMGSSVEQAWLSARRLATLIGPD